jgi:hypothetical protein
MVTIDNLIQEQEKISDLMLGNKNIQFYIAGEGVKSKWDDHWVPHLESAYVGELIRIYKSEKPMSRQNFLDTGEKLYKRECYDDPEVFEKFKNYDDDRNNGILDDFIKIGLLKEENGVLVITEAAKKANYIAMAPAGDPVDKKYAACIEEDKDVEPVLDLSKKAFPKNWNGLDYYLVAEEISPSSRQKLESSRLTYCPPPKPNK